MKKTIPTIMSYEPMEGPNSINMTAKQVPVMPSKADLDRGYVAIPVAECARKTGYTNWFDSQDEAREAGGFVPRGNLDERL